MSTTEEKMTGIQRAVQAAGSQNALVERLLLDAPSGRAAPSQQAVSQWVKRGFVPAGRANDISAVTGVPAIDLVSKNLRLILSS
jgi:DNA-binding transcriptional regulator YdaS (Cro superfamily)